MAKGGRGRGRHSGGQQRGGGTATAVRGAGPGTRAPSNMADAAQRGGAEVQPWGLADAMNAIAARAGMSNPMPRSPLDQVPFGPNWALPPQPLDPARPDTGRPEPRVFEYPVAFNIPGNGNRPIPWDTLYAASTNVDIIRRCIEIRKRHLRGMEWGWAVTEEAIAEALLGDPAAGRMDVETKLREQYLPEIRRATEFWKKPWRANGLSFGQWLNGWMDQHLVLDGVAVYPRMTYGGDVTDLEIIDASTIKLLLDNRGARPEHPFPAFQQELYGFPRGEFTVSVGPDGMMHGGYAADQLYYHRENFRPQTPYGFSAVEQSLISARLYLKRQGWMLAEYDDGSTPLMWLVPAPTAEMWSQMSADQRRRWEQSLNDELAGNQGGRHRVKVTPPGFNPIAMPSVDERYKPEYDMFLIKMAAGFFNVTVAELGLTEPKGLGSSGYHEGQEAVEGRVGQRPDTVMVAESINDLSYDFLRIPREIEFKFIDPQADDEKTKAEVAGMRRARGTITLNDERREIGMAPLPFKEADMPMLLAGDKATPLEGLAKVLELAQQAQQASLEASNAQMEADGETADLEAEELEGASAEKALEMASYRRWARKRGGRAGRMFICKALDPADWPGSAVPADVDFEHWEWVPDDAEIVKAFGGNDNWRTLARDHRGRWMPRGRMRVDPLGPATPGKEVLSGLQREAAARRGAGSSGRRDWPPRQLSGDEESTPAGRRYAAAVAAYDAVRGESYGPDTPREQRNDRARRLQSAQDEVRAALDELERGGEQSTESHSTSADTPTTMQDMTTADITALRAPMASVEDGQRRIWQMHESNRLAAFPRDPIATDPDAIKPGQVIRTSSGWAVVTRGPGTTARTRNSIQILEGGGAYKREYSLSLAREYVTRDAADRQRFAAPQAERDRADDAPATPEPAKPTKPTKRSYTVTLPDGSTQTRRTERNYTHAVILTKDNHALAAMFEERAATAASRGRQNDAERAAAAAASYRALPQYEHSLVSMSGSEAGARKRADELVRKQGDWFSAEVREVTADAPAQSPAAVTPGAGNVAAREFSPSVAEARYARSIAARRVDDLAAALHIGGENKDLISIDSPQRSVLDTAGNGVRGEDLAPGDRIVYAGVGVTVLSAPTRDAKDKFGREMWQFRARRDDTGTEGPMQFGDGGMFQAEPQRSVLDTVRESSEQATPLRGDDDLLDDIEAMGRSGVSLAALRRKMGGTRAEQDAALKRLDRARVIVLDPDPNRKALTQEARDAAMEIGGEPKHLVSILNRPSRQAPAETSQQAAARPFTADELHIGGENKDLISIDKPAAPAPISHRGGTITPVAPSYGDPEGYVHVVAADGTVLGRRADVATAKLALDNHAKGKPQAGARRMQQSQADRMAAVAASTPDAPVPAAPELSRKQREMGERFDRLAGEHAADPDVAMWRGRVIDLTGQMEQVGRGVLAQREADSIRDQMNSVQLGFTHAMAGAQAAAEVRAAGGDERAQRIARSRATLDSRARKVQKDLENVERQIRDYTGETRKMLRKRINDLKAERQRYLDRIERVERDVDTKLAYDESGNLVDVRHEPPAPAAPSAQSVNDAMAAQMAAQLANPSTYGAAHGKVGPSGLRKGMRVQHSGTAWEVMETPRKARPDAQGRTGVVFRAKREDQGIESTMRLNDGFTIALAAPKGGDKVSKPKREIERPADRGAPLTPAEQTVSRHREVFQAWREGRATTADVEAARVAMEAAKTPVAPDTVTRTGDAALAAAPRSVEATGARKVDRAGTAALERYRGKDFTEINRELRAGNVSAANRKTVEQIDRVMDESRLTDQVEVYRGIGNVEAVFGDAARRKLVGHEWADAAPQSTTTDADIADRFLASGGSRRSAAVIKMSVPAGVGAIEMSDARYEAELLLQRGLRMRVVSDTGPWRRGQKKPRMIEVEVIPVGAA